MSETAPITAREALAFYANADNWRARGHAQIDADTAPVLTDKGARARSALSAQPAREGLADLIWPYLISVCSDGNADSRRLAREIAAALSAAPTPAETAHPITTAREALELAANRFDRVVLDQEFGSERRYVVSEWADEARAAAAALSVQPAREGLLGEILNELQSVLCDPEGRCCIDGSDGDRAAVDGALAQLAALSAAPAVQPAREGLRRSELTECRQAIIDARSDDDDVDVARSRERLLARIDAALSAAPAPVERTNGCMCAPAGDGTDSICPDPKTGRPLCAAPAPVQTGWQDIASLPDTDEMILAGRNDDGAQMVWRASILYRQVHGRTPAHLGFFPTHWKRLDRLPPAPVETGWKLVPIEPTDAMTRAGFDACEVNPRLGGFSTGNEARRAIYDAMIAAAPLPPAPSTGEG